MSTKLQRVLLVCAAANLAVAAWDVATGGIYFTLFGIVFSSWEVGKPVRYAAICAAVALWLRDRGAATTSWEIVPRFSAEAARALAFASIVIAGFLGIRVAGGADAFGYVSQSQLWTEGRLIAADPLAPLAKELGAAVAPLGYALSRSGEGLVPTYPPGLPLVMAFAQRLAGREAVYAIVPLFGGLTIWMTYLIGVRVADGRTGLVAALVVTFSPLFMFHTFEPMSDIPATAWWSAAWAMALAPGRASAFGAGVSVAAAVLTRPNLAPLAVFLLPVIATPAHRLHRLLLFAGAAAAGAAVVAAVNASLYGSTFASGYGSLAGMFGRDHAAPNLARYSRWMLDLHTPILLLAVVAPLVRRSRAVVCMWLFCAAVGASYLFYLVFDHWPFARFLLPALPLLCVLVSIALLRGLEALPPTARGAVLLATSVVLAGWYLSVAERLGVFTIHGAEQRYAIVGQRLGVALPPQAIVLSVIESGSVRWHGNRLTIRWDYIPPDRFDATLALLRSKGYLPYLLLEDWEEPLFRQQFAAATPFGRLDWPAAMEYRGAMQVRLYRPDDRARHLAGAVVSTTVIAAP